MKRDAVNSVNAKVIKLGEQICIGQAGSLKRNRRKDSDRVPFYSNVSQSCNAVGTLQRTFVQQKQRTSKLLIVKTVRKPSWNTVNVLLTQAIWKLIEVLWRAIKASFGLTCTATSYISNYSSGIELTLKQEQSSLALSQQNVIVWKGSSGFRYYHSSSKLSFARICILYSNFKISSESGYSLNGLVTKPQTQIL